MYQETGETRNAIIEDDNKLIEQIINANKSRREKYWIVLFAKHSRSSVDGKPTLVKHIKPYNVKPISQIGSVIGEVDNSTGTVSWEVNMPQVPFDFDGLVKYGAESTDEVVVETTTIPNAYLTR